MTPTANRLYSILNPYVLQREHHYQHKIAPPKPMNLIVITDGCANSNPAVPLLEIARRLDAIEADPSQLGVQFVQVGNDTDAAAALAYLDDALYKEHGCRDFIDTVPYDKRGMMGWGEGGVFDEDLVLKTVLGSVNRRVDRRGF